MVKNLVITCILVISICLFGCTHTASSYSNNSTASITDTDATDFSFPESAAQQCIAPPSLHSLDEYEEYLDRFIELPADFIHYSAIENCGSFLKFIDVTDQANYQHHADGTISGECRAYRYRLVDQSGIAFNLDINTVDLSSIRIDTSETIKGAVNLHKCTQSDGYYQLGNILYNYYNSSLEQVILTAGNSTISISLAHDKDFSDYQINADTFLGSLLNTETAEIALAELNAKVAQARQEARAEKAN